MGYLISVGLATRNRQVYAEQVIRQVHSLGDMIQIVISDNSDDMGLEEKLKDIIDQKRVKYIYTREKISVVHNYDITAEYSEGEYYICIGDDDIILSYILQLAEWMKKNGYDAVRTSRDIKYRWPGSKTKVGRLIIKKPTVELHEFSACEGVISALKQGCQGYIEADMAGSYHALVDMKRMRQVKEITGYYFYGFSPDIYSATCLSLLPDMKCAYIGFPVSIPGCCALSATIKAVSRTVNLGVEEAIKKYSEEGYQWEKTIPQYYTPETTWADTMIKATTRMKRLDLIEKYYNRVMLTNLICTHWKDDKKLFDALREEEKKMLANVQDNTYSCQEYYNTTWSKLKKRLSGEFRDTFCVSNNYVAVKKTKKYLKKYENKWEKLLNGGL